MAIMLAPSISLNLESLWKLDLIQKRRTGSCVGMVFRPLDTGLVKNQHWISISNAYEILELRADYRMKLYPLLMNLTLSFCPRPRTYISVYNLSRLRPNNRVNSQVFFPQDRFQPQDIAFDGYLSEPSLIIILRYVVYLTNSNCEWPDISRPFDLPGIHSRVLLPTWSLISGGVLTRLTSTPDILMFPTSVGRRDCG